MIVINFSNLIKDISPLLTTLISAFVSYKIARMTIFPKTNTPVLKKQLYCVYLPIFKLIYKNLFKKRSTIEIENILTTTKEFIDKHYELIDSDVIYKFDRCEYLLKEIKNGNLFFETKNGKISNEQNLMDTFQEIEIIVSEKFDFIRAKLGMPTRSLKFKIFMEHLTPLRKTLLDTTLKIILTIILFAMVIVIVNFIIDTSVSIYEKAVALYNWLFS